MVRFLNRIVTIVRERMLSRERSSRMLKTFVEEGLKGNNREG